MPKAIIELRFEKMEFEATTMLLKSTGSAMHSEASWKEIVPISRSRYQSMPLPQEDEP